MEFDKLSPHILRGEIYVKEAGKQLSLFYKGFDNINLIASINSKQIFIRIKGHLDTWLIPIEICNDYTYASKFVLRTDEFIYFYNMQSKDIRFSDKPTKAIRITYFQSIYYETLTFIPDTQGYRNFFSWFKYQHQVASPPEDSNLFILSRNNKTYLIVIL